MIASPLLGSPCRVSTEPCAQPGASWAGASCSATNATGGCSWLQGLTLPGLGDGGDFPGTYPYTVAVLPLLPAVPSTSVPFEIRVTSTNVPPAFALSGN